MEKLEHSEKAGYDSRLPLLFFLIITLLLAVGRVETAGDPSYSPGSGMRLFNGVLALILIFILSGYRLRKAILRYPAGSLHGWAQTHVYLGALCLALVFMHSGFKPGGAMSALTLALFLLVIASGVVGALLYQVIPLSLSKYGKDLLSSSVISGKFHVLLDDADKQVESSSADFKEAYADIIRPRLASTTVRWIYLFMEEREVIQRCRALTEEAKLRIPASEIYDMDLIGAILLEKERLSFKWTKLCSLRLWLYFHVPATMALLTALFVHVSAAFYF